METHIILARRHLAALDAAAAAEQLLPLDAAHCRYAFRYDLGEGLRAAIEGYSREQARRLERLAVWKAALRPLQPEVSFPEIPMPCPWRAVVKAKDRARRDRIVARLRSAGFDVGVNYPPLWTAAPGLLGGQRHADGDAWGDVVMTLWLTTEYDDRRIREAAVVIQQALAQVQG